MQIQSNCCSTYSIYNRCSLGKQSAKQAEVSFGGGLNAEIRKKIQNTDIKDVVSFFNARNIETDFGDNKVIAACCQMTAKIFEDLNLPLPSKIIACDFSKYPKLKNTSLGSCKFYNDSPRTVFFNTYYLDDIGSINLLKTIEGINHTKSSDHFLSTFIHEFSHCCHHDNICKKFGYGKFYHLLKEYPRAKFFQPDAIDILEELGKMDTKKVSKLISSQLGTYATTNFLELVAEAHTKVITKALNSSATKCNYNPFLKNQFTNNKKLNSIISASFNGDLERLRSLVS